MDGISSALDPDELMDLDEPESYELEEDEDDIPDDPAASPFQQFSSGPASNATSTASSPANNEDFPAPYNFTGKPLTIKRGRGRPRRESGKPSQRRAGTGVPRVRRAKPAGFSRCRGSRSVRQPDRMDFEFSYISPNSMDDLSLTDADAFFFPDRDRPAPLFEELPYAPEAWPGKVCALCNLGERSQLGQGEMMRLSCPDGFTPQRLPSAPSTPTPLAPDRDSGDKSPRGPVTCRRNKNFSRSRSFVPNNEHVDELTIIGHVEEPNVNALYEASGQFYVHRNCALWSSGVTRAENQALENVGPIVLRSSSQKCSFCGHYGASLTCSTTGCSRAFHFPCATASGAFQNLPTLQVFCNGHLGEAALCCEGAVCNTCKTVGDVANLMYCSSCGIHYHGSCVGLAQLPGVRAGWQCRKCRSCQVCRMMGDETKLMSCEQCDKVYHASCQRPIVTSIPKYGWKCRCCRVCGDCGSRTPGAGLSSRWHLHYTVCDSCYQQRNKGCCCPVCQRAYRSHGHREMVQCSSCRKFVHGTCDPEADLGTYQHKRELNPDYEYHCIICKNSPQQQSQTVGRSLIFKRSSTEDPGDLSASQESLYDDMSEFDSAPVEDTFRGTGLGKGKPYAGKLAKKKLNQPVGRPKGFGKGLPGKQSFMKRQQRIVDFGRKRGAKPKIRGVFGVPGVGLSRPVADGKSDDEPGVENRLALCSAKDKFVLTQDICVMCGSLGTDQEGCLIACVQCGQCYHPYCLSVKVTKVILQKGWRCLDCTVCEGCGQRNDEGRLILCDDCDVSYHTYCMDPPLDYVPHGNWKCKWCACCRTCGSADPGFNSTWMNGCTECGPCASLVACASCNEPYCEGDLIIQCAQCERWLHGPCDLIKTEQDAEKCAEDGYSCVLCRPRDVPPPHLLLPPMAVKPPTPAKSPEVRSHANFVVDGVALSESGHSLIKSLSLEHHGTRKKRKKIVPVVHDKEAGIMATIESVVAGGSAGENSFEDTKIEMVDLKEEPQELYKEGMIWTKEDGPPPEGFTVVAMESGMCVLRRKRQRNLQKLGIGGFLVRMRGFKSGQENDDIDTLPGQTVPMGAVPDVPMQLDADKPKKKPIRRKTKSKLVETFPPYLQEAFFGKDLMDLTQLKQEVESGASSDEERELYKQHAIKLTAEELQAVETAKRERKSDSAPLSRVLIKEEKTVTVVKQEEEEDDETNEDLKDVLALPGDLLDTDLVNSIIEDDELTKNAELDALADDDGELAQTLGSSENSKDAKDELSDILGSHFSLESIPNINSKDVEDIFKGVLTDESQESQLSQESNVFPPMPSTQTSIFPPNLSQNAPPIPQMHMPMQQVRPTTLPGVQHVSFPPSPYHSEYSNSPQFSPAFSEPPSPWVNMGEGVDMEGAAAGVASTYNQRSSEKMKADEGLGSGATISAVLYANMNHPEWKTEQPAWTDRYKQILKKWRTLSQDQKAPYLQQARDNRSQLRMKKQQQSQTVKEAPPPPAPSKPPPAAPALAAALETALGPPSQAPQTTEDQEKLAQQQKTAREAEQERQWKQLQALRQQQAQQQQHVIHEQRVQAIARVQRTISDPGPPFLASSSPQQVSTTPQEGSRAASPFIGIKSPPFAHPSPPSVNIRTPTSSQSPVHEFPAPPPPVPAPNPDQELFADSTKNAALNASDVPFGQPQPASSRTAFTPARPALQGRSDQPEIARQLRDLLQRQQQQLKSFEAQGKARVWNPEATADAPTGEEITFRQPLPPPTARPRVPAPMVVRPTPASPTSMRMPHLEGRLQGLDPRLRLILQQQPRMAGPQAVRFAGTAPRPATIEQYEQLLQRQAQLQARNVAMEQAAAASAGRMPLGQAPTAIQKSGPVITPTLTAAVQPQAAPAPNEQEIPDNVTAELEKLEQETGTMAELQGVSEILGGLGDDDDELLAEMGADFNILEYADPELEALAGEKTNILDLDLEDDNLKQEKKREQQQQLQRQQQQPSMATSTAVSTAPTAAAPATSAPNRFEHLQAPTKPLPATEPQPAASESARPAPSAESAPPPAQAAASEAPAPPQASLAVAAQQIHQQMLHQVGCKMSKYVQQAAAIGKPMPPGSKLQTPDGIVGIVLANNNVQLQIPPNFQQRLLLQLQNQKLQMRLGRPAPRPPAGINQAPTGQVQRPRMPVVPPPPPPPYPGPPPPYPGNVMQQQEQPLLLEDLLEQEKREQEKQHQTGAERTEPEPALLSDHDFERLKADVFSSEAVPSPWPTNRPAAAPTQATTEITTRIQMFNANLMPAPPLPPDTVVTEQDKQAQLVYEQWLSHQNNVLSQQLRYYETEVQKLRKSRKSLNSKQRQLRKTGNQLNEVDAAEFQRISAEQAILQKHLESSRKQSRQHSMLVQEYRNKQQKAPAPPLGTSPIHHSPMLSPQRSPMNSPGPMVAHSPALLPSPGGSPGSVPSPSQICLPPPAPRMTSPQHRRVVTSPSYATELRNTVNQMRFMRPTAVVDHQRARSQTPNPHQALLQKQLHQQALLHQQQQSEANQGSSDGSGVLHSPRVAQLIQHRNLGRQQQMTPQQHQMAMQLQARLQQQQQQSPQSPIMPPKSPLHNQQPPSMSPHSMPSSPMPPKSPLLGFNTPGSPAGRATYQPNSPMMMQYQPPSPLMRRPPSVENPRTPYSMDAHLPDHGGGGGNPNNPLNPVPMDTQECGRLGLRGGAQLPPLGFRYRKLGLRGGAPMWGGFGRGEKRVPTPPAVDPPPADNELMAKPKKEPHISKVSILKKKATVPKSSPKLMAAKGSTDVHDYDAELGSAKKDLPEMVVDFEDDNSTVLASEVSLSSAAQQNDDELEMTETLSQDDIGEVLASPMEADQISDEFLLFQGNMVVDLSGGTHYSDKEETEEEYANIVIRSPTTSDDEFIMQGRTKKYNILGMGSPEPDTNTEPEDEESEVVIIDQAEEQISTKEDFEELIDEGSRKKTTDFQKFTTTAAAAATTTSVYSFPPKTTVRPAAPKTATKISLITPTIIQNFAPPNKLEPQQLIITPTSKITTTSAGSKLTSIILTHNAVRSNLFKAAASPGITIVSAGTSQIASILPSKFTVPVISASAVRQLPNVKVIDKPSCVTTTHDCALPKKIFEEDSEGDDKKVPVFVKKGDALVLASASQQRKSIAVRKPVAPELKMTAQVIQETMQITATETVSGFEGSAEDKSVVISIPSPTPSQEQMLDNIALQALEDNRRREFESFEDVLDMIENMQHSDEQQKPAKQPVEAKQAMPQLSPLSQPAELTSNMASASQQLRTLLSTLQTTSANVDARPAVTQKPVNVAASAAPIVASRVIQKAQPSSKGSLTLTAMLQNQPAATPTTKSSADTITAASLLATPVSLSRTSFSPALAQAQPNAISVIASSSPFRGNLLHTQLTKARTKSLDDIKELKEEAPEQDSQNVLLKKLLQNTACASTQSPPPSAVAEPPKTSPPTLASLLPPAKSDAVPTPKPRSLVRETSFVSSPVVQQLHVDVKKPPREELLSPPTPDQHTPPLPIKKESPPIEIKKELLDETSQHSEVSDQGKGDLPIKEEGDAGESALEKVAVLDKEELKKQKRRMYNQKRRQNQMLNKELNKPNKRPRKNSKLDEDYDSYIDSVLGQIRHLPPMVVSEPVLMRNYGVVPVFGAGDLSKIGTKHFDPRRGDLLGDYGCAVLPDSADFYSTEPYGTGAAVPLKPPPSTQRGFYEQEFPLIKFDGDDDNNRFFDLFAREDTPDSIVSGSSSDCDPAEGLRLISDDEEEPTRGRQSPPMPVLKPIAIRLKPSGLCLDREFEQEKPRAPPPEPLKDGENIKVTLTLTSSAAEDIVGVLRDLANILQIPPPTTYQIVDRTASPAAHKLGMYRTKGKDGKEGAPIDIQSILNGATKFCKHCDVVILNNLIRKRLSDLPFLDSKDLEGEELYFCGTPCYMQFALMHRSPSIPEEKAAAIIDHLSQRGRKPPVAPKAPEESRPPFAAHFGSMFKQQARFALAPSRAHRNTVYKLWFPGCIQPSQKHKKPTDKEMMEMLYQMGITVTPPKMPDDTRKCIFCQVVGDGVADGPARLLNVDVDKWVHLNCALWSDGVYETVNGALMNLENAMQQSLGTACAHCAKTGATIRCFKARCSSVYHLACAVRDGCVFFKNKTAYCAAHVPKNEKDNELTTLSVGRRVYVNRDENRQVAAVMHHSDTNNLLRVGSLIFLNVGQLMPHQLQNFHTPNHIYPIGYKIIRFYWSMRHLSKRCRYICSIHDAGGRPDFRVLVQEFGEEEVEFRELSPKAAWSPILDKIATVRRENRCLQMFPQFISGEDLFGLTEPAIVRVLESLPGIETLSDYKFKYGRNPLLELPLAINPTGAARAEPRLRHQTHWKRPHTQRTTGSSRPLFGPSPASGGSMMGSSFGESVCPYSKQFVHSKSSQYKKMKQEWRNNVYLGRSKIQGLGLYAARDLEKHTMVIEYIGEVIRTELSECREKQYEAKNRGIYMFRLDDDRVVDATLSGGLARYINHSCNPNCVAETVEIDRDLKIIIFSKRRIQRGEELAYDYKFDIEDDQNKISCMCGAPNCRKWMN